MEDGTSEQNSYVGTLFTFLLFLIVSGYAILKFNTLITLKDVDIIYAETDSFYTFNDTYTYENGFNFAVAFTKYDNVMEPILEPEYGELVFTHYNWGQTEESNESGRKKIKTTHACTKKELGIDDDLDENSSKFF